MGSRERREKEREGQRRLERERDSNFPLRVQLQKVSGEPVFLDQKRVLPDTSQSPSSTKLNGQLPDTGGEKAKGLGEGEQDQEEAIKTKKEKERERETERQRVGVGQKQGAMKSRNAQVVFFPLLEEAVLRAAGIPIAQEFSGDRKSFTLHDESGNGSGIQILQGP